MLPDNAAIVLRLVFHSHGARAAGFDHLLLFWHLILLSTFLHPLYSAAAAGAYHLAGQQHIMCGSVRF